MQDTHQQSSTTTSSQLPSMRSTIHTNSWWKCKTVLQRLKLYFKTLKTVHCLPLTNERLKCLMMTHMGFIPHCMFSWEVFFKNAQAALGLRLSQAPAAGDRRPLNQWRDACRPRAAAPLGFWEHPLRRPLATILPPLPHSLLATPGGEGPSLEEQEHRPLWPCLL